MRFKTTFHLIAWLLCVLLIVDTMMNIVYADNDIIFYDECNNILQGGWTVSEVKQGTYITDSDRSSGTIENMKHVPEGEYLFYADENAGNNYNTMRRDIDIGSGPWTFEFEARIVDLMTPKQYPTDRGLCFEIFAEGKMYKFTFNDKNKIHALINWSGVSNQIIEVDMPKDDEFHKWSFAHVGGGKIIVALDEERIGIFNDIGIGRNVNDGINIVNACLNWEKGSNEVYIRKIKMTKSTPVWAEYDPYISGCSILPKSDSSSTNIVVNTSSVDPKWYSQERASIRATLSQKGKLVTQNIAKLTKASENLNLAPNGYTGEMDLLVELIDGEEVISELSKKVYIHAQVEEIKPHGNIDAQDGKTYLFTAVDQIEGEKGEKLADIGWTTSPFKYEGMDETYPVIQNMKGATSIKIPVNLQGWYGVYIGYVTGTEGFDIGINDEMQPIAIQSSSSEEEMYGSKGQCEVFAFAYNFDNEGIIVSSHLENMVRIAYIKFKPLTAEEITLWQKPSDSNTKKVIYNNDGYSDFFDGIYTDTNTLERLVVDRYKDMDVSTIYWCLGTTMLLNYDSQYAGYPYEGSEDFEHLMRDGDKKAREQILHFIDQGTSPLEIVARRANELGMKTFASLRMSAFYNPASHPWLNGSVYNEYSDYRLVNKSGEVESRLSYAYPEVRGYIKNVLKESSSFPCVEGVELDFCRYPYVMGYEPIITDEYEAQYGTKPQDETTEEGIRRWNEYKAEIMTQFLREIREELNDKQISVRIPYTDYAEYGLDVQRWIDEELIDILVPSHIGHEEFYPDIEEFVSMTKGSNVVLYGGINGTLGGHDLTKEEEDLIKRGIKINVGHTKLSLQQYKLRAYEMYQAGYDGIYIFNNWKGQNSLGQLGDKIQLEKWYAFAYPAEWVQNLVWIDSAEQAVIARIDALPSVEEINLDYKDAIRDARIAYEALSVDQKTLVTNIDKLIELEVKLLELEDLEVVDAVIKQISQLPTEISLEDKETVETTRAAYEALTDTQKLLVDKEILAKLVEVELKLSELIEAENPKVPEDPNDKEDPKDSSETGKPKAVVNVINLINKLPKLDDLTLSDKVTVAIARDAYELLTDEEKALVTNIDVLERAEARILDLQQESPKPSETKDLGSELPRTGIGGERIVLLGRIFLVVGACLFMLIKKKVLRI